MQKWTLFLFLLCLSPSLGAQTYGAFMRHGDRAAAEQDWHSALYYFRSALQLKERPEARFKAGKAAFHFQSYEPALADLEQVFLSKNEKAPSFRGEAALLAGKAARAMGRYEQAVEWFEKAAAAEARREAEAQHGIAACRWALQRQQEAEDMEIEHLDKTINSEYSDFAPLPVGDTLYFSSYRYRYRDDKHDPPRRITRVVYHKPGRRRPQAVRRGLNDQDRHTAHLDLSADGQRQYFSRCSFISDVRIRCELWYRDRRDQRRWNRPRKLGKLINLEGYTHTQPAAGRDSATGKDILFFVSDRPGGAGGLDIWYSVLEKDGNFSPPQNLKEINTPQDELTPFFHTPTQRLYFSSDGRPGMGGFDVYESSWPLSESKEPRHLPYPLNGSYNELDFTPEDSLHAYFASNRPGSFYLNEENKTCCNDIYRVTFRPEEPKETPEEPEIAEVPKPEPEPEPKEPEALEDFLPLALYFDNDRPDPRTLRETTRLSYGETFREYYARKRTFIESYTQPLSGAASDSARQELDNFFENQVKKGNDWLVKFSEILLQRLQEGEEVEIFVKGFTSPRAQSDYNRKLGQRRISSVRNHFAEYREGIFREYLSGGQLLISQRSFGEEQADASVSDALEDQRSSIFSVPASRERRVEIVEIIRN